MKLLAAGGRIVCFGAATHEAGSLQILRSIKFALSFGFFHPIPLLLNSKSLIGVNMLRLSDNRPLALKRCLDGVVQMHRDGILKPTVGGRYKVEQIAEAHEFLGGRGSMGKIVVSW